MPPNFKFLTHEEFHLLSQSEKVRYIALAMEDLAGWSAGLLDDPTAGKSKRRKRNGAPR